MKKVLHTYNLIMDSSINPLKNVKNLQVRHMVMQLLACMWSLIFGMYIVESIYAIIITMAVFDTASRSPESFTRRTKR